MKVMRIFLLMFMSFVLLVMLAYEGLHDSKWIMVSRPQLHRAEIRYADSPSEQTMQELETARGEAELAKRAHYRSTIVFETFMLGLLGVSAYAFIRAGKSDQKISIGQ